MAAAAAAAAAKSLQSCLTLRDPIDGSPPGSPVPGILQAKTLEWVAISFSKIIVYNYIKEIFPKAMGYLPISNSFKNCYLITLCWGIVDLKYCVSFSPWSSLGQNTRVGSLSLLQGIFPTQGWNPGLLHCRRILYHCATLEVTCSVSTIHEKLTSLSSPQPPHSLTHQSCPQRDLL